MKTIVIISSEDQYFETLAITLSKQFTVERYSSIYQNAADLILVVAEDRSSEYFNAHAALKNKFNNVPVVFLWVQEDSFRLLHEKNIDALNGIIVQKDDDSLLKVLSEAITKIDSENNHQHLSDIQSDIHNMYCGKSENGALEVEYNNFARIYQFVEQLIVRSGKPMQTLLLSLTPYKGMTPSIENLTYAKSILSDAIQQTLRKNDVMTHYSASQILVLLVDADDAGGHFATNRIINSFFGMYEEDFYEIDYDIRPVGKKRK